MSSKEEEGHKENAGNLTEREFTTEKVKLVNESKLLFDMGADQIPIVYDPIYNISFCGMQRLHPFDAGKWGKVYEYLKEAGIVDDRKCVRPKEATQNDLLVVHTRRYLCSLTCSPVVAAVMEVPCVACVPNCLVQRYALRRFRYHTGGTILAAKLALDRGWAINVGGGFHHCSADSGGGFCAYADISLAITFLFVKQLIRTVMIVDLDAHQGNGHERDFDDDNGVYIFDMYNAQIYPGDGKAKRGIERRVELRSGIGDDGYLTLLRLNLIEALNEFPADLIVYNAGTDCLIGDPLGCMDITAEGIIRRDELVFERAKRKNIPIVMLTSGGYQRNNARIIADSIINLRQKNLI